MNTFEQLWVWRDPAIAKSLGWYLDVSTNRMPAKFRIARTIPVSTMLRHASEAALWDELDRLTPVFLARLRRIRDCGKALGPAAEGANLVNLCCELARCPAVDEVGEGLRYAHQLGLHFETITYEKNRMGLGTPDVA